MSGDRFRIAVAWPLALELRHTLLVFRAVPALEKKHQTSTIHHQSHNFGFGSLEILSKIHGWCFCLWRLLFHFWLVMFWFPAGNSRCHAFPCDWTLFLKAVLPASLGVLPHNCAAWWKCSMCSTEMKQHNHINDIEFHEKIHEIFGWQHLLA